MMHDKGDNNGASTAFFWIPADQEQTVVERNAGSLFQHLNNQFCLFAYCIEGNNVLESLKPGDVLESATVEDGIWELVQPEESFDS